MTAAGSPATATRIYDAEGSRGGTVTSAAGADAGQERRPRLRARGAGAPGTKLSIDCRGKRVDAEWWGPFYKRGKNERAVSDDLYYTKDHEWARIEDATAEGRDHRRHALRGRAARRRHPGRAAQGGRALKPAEVFGSVESVKAVSDLFAPLSGKVVKVNSPLARFARVRQRGSLRRGLDDPGRRSQRQGADGLMDAEAYQTFLREQAE